MYVWYTCLYVYVHVKVSVAGCGGQRLISALSFSHTLPFCFWERVLRWTCSVPLRLVWLVSKMQGSTCLLWGYRHMHWVQLLGSAGYVNPSLYACVTSASSTEPSLTRIFICVHWISLNQRGFSYFLKMLTSINYSLLFKEIRSFLILMCTAQGHWGLGPRMAVLVSGGIFRRWSLVETL